MESLDGEVGLIVGAGSGLSASIARALSGAGMKLALAARTTDDLSALASETRAKLFTCDAAKQESVRRLLAEVDETVGEPAVAIYNASYRTRGALVDLDPVEVEKAIAVSAFGGFLVAQEAAKRM